MLNVGRSAPCATEPSHGVAVKLLQASSLEVSLTVKDLRSGVDGCRNVLGPVVDREHRRGNGLVAVSLPRTWVRSRNVRVPPAPRLILLQSMSSLASASFDPAIPTVFALPCRPIQRLDERSRAIRSNGRMKLTRVGALATPRRRRPRSYPHGRTPAPGASMRNRS